MGNTTGLKSPRGVLERAWALLGLLRARESGLPRDGLNKLSIFVEFPIIFQERLADDRVL
jgi:hypothetical protein